MDAKTIRVLLIEDDPEDVYLFKEHLLHADGPRLKFQHETASTLKGALEALDSMAFDVVLVDLMLPDSQGIETFLRVHAEKPDVPIVILTGLSDEAPALEAVGLGAQDYLVKGGLGGQLLRRTLAYAIERRQLLAQVEGIIDRAADGMVVVDEEGFVRYVNASAERIFGLEAEEMLGKPFPYEVKPDLTRDLKLTLKDGESKVAEMRVTAIDWKKTPACLASIRDITELRRMEQLKAEIHERRRLDQLKDEFISIVSHELRSPLAIVKGAIDNLKDGLLGPMPAPQEQVVDLAHRNVKRLSRIINNLLDLSRLESGKAKINRRTVDPRALIKDAAEAFRAPARDRKISLCDELPAELPSVYVDPDMIAEVLNNLLDNALRFAKVEVRIHVTAVAASGARQPAFSSAADGNRAVLVPARRDVQVSVIDDGEGVPAGNRVEIFDKFFQVQRILGSGYKGTGLGLAICKEIILRHNGNIWVDGRDGGGAQFHFILPGCLPDGASAESCS